MYAATIAFADGAAVHGEQIDLMTLEDREEFGKHAGIIEANASLDGERNLHGLAQRSEDGIHPVGFAQKTAAGAFLVNHRSRAAEIQIDGGDRMLLEFLRCGDQ